MPTLRTSAPVAATAKTQFAIAAHPQWEHYDPKACPLPIRNWIADHCPGIAIERVELEGKLYCEFLNCEADFATSDEIPRPIFRLGLNDAQAKAFSAAWSHPSRQPADGNENFYFILLEPPIVAKAVSKSIRLQG